MDRVTRAKLESLIHELRSRSVTELGSLADVARRFQLDPLMVRRVAEGEGVSLNDAEASAEPPSDPNQSTQIMSLDELLRDA
ncbi:MAG: hypothetical protein AAGA54_20975 [Myxococcota bacterium]